MKIRKYFQQKTFLFFIFVFFNKQLLPVKAKTICCCSSSSSHLSDVVYYAVPVSTPKPPILLAYIYLNNFPVLPLPSILLYYFPLAAYTPSKFYAPSSTNTLPPAYSPRLAYVYNPIALCYCCYRSRRALTKSLDLLFHLAPVCNFNQKVLCLVQRDIYNYTNNKKETLSLKKNSTILFTVTKPSTSTTPIILAKAKKYINRKRREDILIANINSLHRFPKKSNSSNNVIPIENGRYYIEKQKETKNNGNQDLANIPTFLPEPDFNYINVSQTKTVKKKIWNISLFAESTPRHIYTIVNDSNNLSH